MTWADLTVDELTWGRFDWKSKISTNFNLGSEMENQWRIQRGAEGTFALPLKKGGGEEKGGGVSRPSIKHISIHSFAC